MKGPSNGNPQETAYLEGFVEVDRIHNENGNRGMLIAVRKGILATPKSKKASEGGEYITIELSRKNREPLTITNMYVRGDGPSDLQCQELREIIEKKI